MVNFILSAHIFRVLSLKGHIYDMSVVLFPQILPYAGCWVVDYSYNYDQNFILTQKYKDYLRRICEAKAKEDDVISQNWSHYPIRSNFTMSRFPNLAQHSYLVNYANAKSLMAETTKNNTNHVASPKLGNCVNLPLYVSKI